MRKISKIIANNLIEQMGSGNEKAAVIARVGADLVIVNLERAERYEVYTDKKSISFDRIEDIEECVYKVIS